MLLKKYSGIIIICILSTIPVIFWFQDSHVWDITTTEKNIGQLTAIVGTILFCVNFILSARVKFIEPLFHGLNRVYVIHEYIGIIAFFLLLFHPLFIAAWYLPNSVSQAFHVFIPDTPPKIFGITALVILIILLFITAYAKLPYHIWKTTHAFLGTALFFGSMHVFFVDSDISHNFLLRYYILFIICLSLIALLYRTVFGKYFVQRFEYKIIQTKVLANDVVEITMAPLDKKMIYHPGQFVFIDIDSTGITKEAHPFSLISSPLDEYLQIAAKPLGDFTKTLKQIKDNSHVRIEGPYGRFLFIEPKNYHQVWVAGGIGITPFISMAKTLPKNSGYRVTLFYTISTPEEASYLDLIQSLAQQNTSFTVIPYFTNEKGRLTANIISYTVHDFLLSDFFICGPLSMMKSMKEQLVALKVPMDNIHTEEFSIG